MTDSTLEKSARRRNPQLRRTIELTKLQFLRTANTCSIKASGARSAVKNGFIAFEMETVCIKRRQYCIGCIQLETFKTKFFVLPRTVHSFFRTCCKSIWDDFNRVTLVKLSRRVFNVVALRNASELLPLLGARENLRKFTTFISRQRMHLNR